MNACFAPGRALLLRLLAMEMRDRPNSRSWI